MVIDYDFACVILTQDEAKRYHTDTTYRVRVWAMAILLHDDTERTVEIRRAGTGELLATHPNEAGGRE